MFDENTMDDMVQKKEDAPSTEKTDATAEAEVTGQAQEGAQQATTEAKAEEQTATAQDVAEDAFDLDLAAGETFNLKDTKVVGEGAGQHDIRETLEETGLDLRTPHWERLGRLVEDRIAGGGPKSLAVAMYGCAARSEGGESHVALTLQPTEVAAAWWVDLEAKH